MRTKEEIDKLVEDNIKLIYYVINKKFSIFIKIYPSIEDDMFQEGSIALFKAAKEYDESKGVKFSTFEFPIGFDNGIRLKDVLEQKVDEKFYINNEKAAKLIEEFKSTGKKSLNINPSGKGIGGVVRNDEISSTLTKAKGEGLKIVYPCIIPERIEKRQNGRRFKEDNEPMFTITSQDRHGVLEAKRIGGLFDNEKGKHQAGSIWDKEGLSPTLDTMQGGYRQPCVIEDSK